MKAVPRHCIDYDENFRGSTPAAPGTAKYRACKAAAWHFRLIIPP
jgi:hypothetical protein